MNFNKFFILLFCFGQAQAKQVSAPLKSFSPKQATKPEYSPQIISSLEDALVAAYLYNVNLQNQRNVVNQAVEVVASANSEWNPRVNFSAIQQSGASNTRSKQNIYGDNPSSHSKHTVETAGLKAQQNLYEGGGTVDRQNSAKEKHMAALCALDAQEQKTFSEVISAYVDVIEAEQMLKAEQINEKNTQQLLKQTEVRHIIGDQRFADVATAKARLANAVMKVASAKANIQARRAALFALVGVPLSNELKVPSAYEKLPNTLEELLDKSLKGHPSLIAACHAERASRHDASSVVAQMLPRVDLTGNAGSKKSWNRTKEMNSLASGRKKSYEKNIDLMVEVSIPLITGGQIQSKYRSSEQQVKISRLATEATRREIGQFCTTQFFAFQAAKENVVSAKVALDANKTALDASRAEYDLGIIGLLDTFKVSDYWIASYQQYINTEANFIKSSYNILQLTGLLTASNLKLKVRLYDPFKYYEKYSNAMFSFGEDGDNDPIFSNTQLKK